MKRHLFVTLLAFLLTACTAVSEEPAVDEAAVYTAVARQMYTVDDTFGGTLQPAKVYLVSRTDDSVGDPAVEQGASHPISEAAQQAIVAGLTDLPAEWVWVNSREEVPLDPGNGSVSGEGAIFTFGSIHPQADGTVLVSGSIYVANLAAGGQTYIVEKTERGWTVTGTTGTAWIS